MQATILKTQTISFDKRHFSKGTDSYRELHITHDQHSDKFHFWLGNKGTENLHKISKVYGIDGIGNPQAMKALLKQKTPFVSKGKDNDMTIRLIDKPTESAVDKKMTEFISTKPSKEALISTMKGASLTDGWDMVVVYELDTINNVLKTLYHDPEHKVIKAISLGSVENPYQISYTPIKIPNVFTGLTFNVVVLFDFNFSEPGIQFSADKNNYALLNMPITSAIKSQASYTLKLVSPQPTNTSTITKDNTWYKSTNGKVFTEVSAEEVNKATDPSIYYLRAKDTSLNSDKELQNKLYNLSDINPISTSSVLEGGYALQANVPIACLTDSDNVKTGDEVVTFDESENADAKIILHFNTESGSGTNYVFSKDGNVTEPALVKDYPTILQELKNYFSSNVNDIDYILTSLSNIKANGDVPLTPKSFRFNTQQINKNACLSLFIQTKESGIGPGGSNLNFETIGNKQFIPICNEASTTLLFSRNFMSDFYLPEGLESSNFKDAKGIGTENSPVAVAATYKFKKSVSLSVSLHLSFWESLSSIYTGVSADPVKFKGFPMTIKFTEDNQLVLGVNVHESTTLNLDYSISSGLNIGGATDKGTLHYDVKISLKTLKDEATRPLKWTVTDEGDLTLDNFEISKKDYDIVISIPKLSVSCHSDSRKHIKDEIKRKIGTILPSQKISFNTLQTVAETNLLFNGHQKFVLDTALNVSSPLDIVAFGKIR